MEGLRGVQVAVLGLLPYLPDFGVLVLIIMNLPPKYRKYVAHASGGERERNQDTTDSHFEKCSEMHTSSLENVIPHTFSVPRRYDQVEVSETESQAAFLGK